MAPSCDTCKRTLLEHHDRAFPHLNGLGLLQTLLFQPRVTSEESQSHKALTALTSCAPSMGYANDMTSGSNHGNHASERTREHKERARPGTRFLLWALNKYNLVRCYKLSLSFLLVISVTVNWRDASSNYPCFAHFAKQDGTGITVRKFEALLRLLANPLGSILEHCICTVPQKCPFSLLIQE